MKKILTILLITAAFTFCGAAQAADLSITMHRIEQRYKNDYKEFPLADEEVAKLKEKADRDLHSAMKLAGWYFFHGEYDKSYPLYESCDKKGDMMARFMRGLSVLNGRGGKMDDHFDAITLINEASDYVPVAYLILGDILTDGYKGLVRINLKHAAEAYQKAAQFGITPETINYQAKYDEAMAKVGYGRYGVKDTTGTLALASASGIPALRPEPYDDILNPTPELKALFTYLTENYGTAERVMEKLGSPQKNELVKGTTDIKNNPFTRNILIYPGFKAVFIDLGSGYEWERLVVEGGSPVSFNGAKVGSPSDDVLAVSGVGMHTIIEDYKVTMTDKMAAFEFAEFEVNNDRITRMKAYKVFQ